MIRLTNNQLIYFLKYLCEIITKIQALNLYELTKLIFKYDVY